MPTTAKKLTKKPIKKTPAKAVAAKRVVAKSATAKRTTTKRAGVKPVVGKRSVATRPRSAAHKWVYLFEQGGAHLKDLLGGKGAGVAEMTRAGLPVPPGFTITTEACNAYYKAGEKFPKGMWEQALVALKHSRMAAASSSSSEGG